MMKSSKLVLITLICSFMFSACSTDVDPKEHLVEIYSTAVYTMLENDKALNHNSKFLSLDMDHLPDLTEQDKEDILRNIQEKYKMETMNASFEELKEKGLFNTNTVSLEGVLLRIDNVDIVNSHEVLFAGSKFKSGLGAFDCKLIVHFESKEWRVKEFKITSKS